MPVRRAKSCDNCRVAKARCSLSAPCSRCAKRRLECHYRPARPCRSENRSAEGFRPIRPAVGASLVAEAVTPPAPAEAASSIVGAPEETQIMALTAATAGTQMPDLTTHSDFTSQLFDVPQSFDLSLAVVPTSHSLQASSNNAAYPSFLDLLPSSYLVDLDIPMPASESVLPPPAHLPCTLPTFDKPMLLTTFEPTNFSSGTKALGPQFSQRTRSLRQGSLTAKILFSRLTDYTRMMADGKILPPFIHPPCALGRDYECPPDSPHRCLPETLAICVNLTQMFYSRTPGSHGFVWQQICTHLRQMRVEVSF